MLRLGFVGTGTLAEAVIAGLQETHGARGRFLLSPRSEAVAARLSARYGNVERAESNAAVVEGSDVVFLGMRPQQLDEAVAGLPFRADQVVVSFLAGAPLALILEKVAPATRVVRVNPLPPIRYRKGPVVQFPADPLVEDLFAGLGDLIVAGKESDLRAIGNASALMSTHFELQNVIVDWLVSRDMAPASAVAYVRSMFDGLAAVGLSAMRDGEPLDPAHHETKGGLNEFGRRHLREAGWFDAAARTLDLIEGRVLVRSAPPAA